MEIWCISNLTFLANLGNSMIFEINGDLIRLSQGFRDCQLLARAAESQRSSSLALCLHYLQFLGVEYHAYTLEKSGIRNAKHKRLRQLSVLIRLFGAYRF
jgi:hypothetical protein